MLNKLSSIVAASALLGSAYAKVKYAGVNIAGFDFGCGTDGTCNTASVTPPLSFYGGGDGQGQMNHFVKDDGLNIFRLPVGWQWLTNNTLGGPLNPNNFGEYNTLVQICLNTGASCIVDIHNYARWNGGIIGQGGPTDEQFASVWSQLANVYQGQSKVIFGIMNEPHDLNVSRWGQSVQVAVNAIRATGAKNLITLPGTNYASAQNFVSSGSAAALAPITNPDGTKTNLVFDVHKYLDIDGSGTHTNCVTNNIASTFEPLAQYLNSVGRMAILSETGGGPNDTSCLTDLCQELQYIDQNANVFLGWVGWAAGSFDTSYTITETPFESNGKFTDQPLVTKCIVGEFK
ncbi:Endoglucanase EG-II [Xylographa carneopallida]|nr:Endoglucanase EG-II [Xylographa carneopallida]